MGVCFGGFTLFDAIIVIAMTKAKPKASKKSKRHRRAVIAPKPSNAPLNSDPYALLVEASGFLESGNPDSALPHAQQAVTLLTSSEQVSSSALPALILLGQIQIELGDEDSARKAFKAAVALDPEGKISEDEGGGAEKFLWLAQLSEEGGHDSIHWFEQGATALEREIAGLQSRQFKTEELQDRMVKLSSALCGMIDVWMTDLS